MDFISNNFFLFIFDCKRFGWRSTLTSSFWVFTLFFTLSYPVKYLLIDYNIEYQAPVKPDRFSLSIALLISIYFWSFVYIIKYKPIQLSQDLRRKCIQTIDRKKNVFSFASKLYLIVLLTISISMFWNLYIQNEYILTLAYFGNSQNELRVGNGYYFFMYTLYFKAFLIILFFRENIQKETLKGKLFVVFFLVAITSLMETTLLGTRRPLYFLFYAFALFFFIKKKSNINIFILGVLPILMVFLSSAGQTLRYSFNKILHGGLSEIWIDSNHFIVSIGSTFEGIEHLANFLNRVSLDEMLLGVDQGVSWLFNSGLALIPRILWESKPFLYGSVAQQAYLYPDMYQYGFGQTTFPLGIIIDSIFGFGFIGLLIFPIIYAKLFFYIDKIIFLDIYRTPYKLLIAAVIYINLFNLVRGGTSIIIMIILFLIFSYPINIFDRLKIRPVTSPLR